MEVQDVNIILSDRSKKTMKQFAVKATSQTVYDLLELGNSGKDKSWRAMWLLEKVLETQPDLRTPSLFEKLSDYFEIQNDSSQLRHLLKMLLMYDQEYDGKTVDKSFRIITSVKYDAAVRVHAMQLIYNMSKIYPEFGQELRPLLDEIVMLETKASLLSRAKKILKKME